MWFIYLFFFLSRGKEEGIFITSSFAPFDGEIKFEHFLLPKYKKTLGISIPIFAFFLFIPPEILQKKYSSQIQNFQDTIRPRNPKHT